MTITYDSSTTTYDDSLVTYEGSSGASTGWLFTPPNIKVEPNITIDSTALQNSLWLHYELRERGVNVWILSDGSVVQSDPSPENSNTNLSNVYPWDPFNPSAPYVTSVFIDAGANPQSPTVHTTSHSPYVVAFFAGASSYPVDQATYELLLNYTAFGLGYSSCLTPYA
jgi:hypothetical protein